MGMLCLPCHVPTSHQYVICLCNASWNLTPARPWSLAPQLCPPHSTLSHSQLANTVVSCFLACARACSYPWDTLLLWLRHRFSFSGETSEPPRQGGLSACGTYYISWWCFFTQPRTPCKATDSSSLSLSPRAWHPGDSRKHPDNSSPFSEPL